jgi:hypothetical protein
LGRALFALALFALAMGGLGIIGWAAQRFPDGSLPQILICFSPAFMALIAAVVIMSGGDPPRRIFPPPVPPPQLVTDFMVDRAMEQGRVDSSLTMVPRVRIERMLRAALSGKVNRKNFNGSL